MLFFVQYTLTVKADDGNVYDLAKVAIKIENVNDNPPVFLPYNNNITIQEEEIVPGCIVTVSVLASTYLHYQDYVRLILAIQKYLDVGSLPLKYLEVGSFFIKIS
jgi:hypothetical protein